MQTLIDLLLLIILGGASICLLFLAIILGHIVYDIFYVEE